MSGTRGLCSLTPTRPRGDRKSAQKLRNQLQSAPVIAPARFRVQPRKCVLDRHRGRSPQSWRIRSPLAGISATVPASEPRASDWRRASATARPPASLPRPTLICPRPRSTSPACSEALRTTPSPAKCLLEQRTQGRPTATHHGSPVDGHADLRQQPARGQRVHRGATALRRSSAATHVLALRRRRSRGHAAPRESPWMSLVEGIGPPCGNHGAVQSSVLHQVIVGASPGPSSLLRARASR